MEYSDYDLIKGIKDGDGDALELLVRRWYPRIFGYVQKTLGNEQDAYDITQEIFLSVVQNIKAIYPWSRFKSWIFTIAHNKCLDFLRLQRPIEIKDIQDIEIPDPSPLPDDLIESSLTVEQALNLLSTPQRESVVLHYMYQFTAKEIARMTHTPLPTVKSRITSAKRLLSKFFREGFS